MLIFPCFIFLIKRFKSTLISETTNKGSLSSKTKQMFSFFIIGTSRFHISYVFFICFSFSSFLSDSRPLKLNLNPRYLTITLCDISFFQLILVYLFFFFFFFLCYSTTQWSKILGYSFLFPMLILSFLN